MRALTLSLLLASTGVQAADDSRFDPLSKDELRQIVDLLVESGRTNAATRIARVSRLPSAKDAAPQRRARVVALLDGQTTEIDVDFNAAAISFRPVEQGYAPITSNDWAQAKAVLREDPGWQAALEVRGIEPDDVFCESLSAGYFAGTPSTKARVMRLPCYEVSEATTNIYGRPIEGLVATVDLNAGRVVDILDEGAQPLPAVVAQLPLATEAAPVPADPRIDIDGHRITFGSWSLHAALDDQFGLVVADVHFADGDRSRSILHEGHVSEIFVPYMDPTESWAFRTYLDAGEFGVGTLASPLLPGVDCPASARYIESNHLTPTARIQTRPRSICVFSEPLRGPMWRHYEALNDLSAGATGDALVVRAISSIAHYDYVFDWVFGPSGEIEIRIGATGIDAVKALRGNDNAPEGNRVTPDLIAVLHDHFFSLRLDLDIDGSRNTLVRENFTVNQARENALERSYWQLDPTVVESEGPMKGNGPGIWRIVSDEKGPFNDVTGYQIVPEGTVSLLHLEDSPQRRGAFSSAPLWLTRHKPNERAAAGDYPNQHPGGAGLPTYANAEPTNETDLVLWPTIGFRHVTRVEDWPALSTVWKSVRLRPYGFFSRNPSIPEE